MPVDKGILEEYVATANSGKYGSMAEVNAKFPELKDYDPKVLEEYVATANSGKYKSLDDVNSKFPEFFSEDIKKKSLTTPTTKPSSFGYENISDVPTSQSQLQSADPLRIRVQTEKPASTSVYLQKPLKDNIDASQFAVNQFNKKYQTNYTADQISGKEPLPKPVSTGEAMLGNTLATADKIFSGAARMPMNLTRIVANPLLDAIGVPDEQKRDMLYSFENTDASTRSLKYISDYYNNEADKINQNISDNLKDNPYQSNLDAAKQYGVKIAGFVPYLLSLPVAGEVGGAGVMASMQRNEVANNPHMTEVQKDLNSTMSGIINSVGMKYAGDVLGKNFTPLVEKVGLQQAKEITAKSATTAMVEAIKPYTAITRPIQGALTGAGIQIANEINEGITNPEYDNSGSFNRIMDSAKTFGIMESLGVAAGELLHGGVGNLRKKAQETASKISNIDKDIENPNITPQDKVVLEGERVKLHNELNDNLEKGDKIIEALPEDKKAIVVENNKKINDIDIKISDIKSTPIEPTLSEDSKIAIENKKAEDLKNLESDKKESEKIINQIQKEQEDATKKRKITESDKSEHQDGNQVGETTETGSSDSNVEGGKSKEKLGETQSDNVPHLFTHPETKSSSDNKVNTNDNVNPDLPNDKLDKEGERVAKETDLTGYKEIYASPNERTTQFADLAKKAKGVVVKTLDFLKTLSTPKSVEGKPEGKISDKELLLKSDKPMDFTEHGREFVDNSEKLWDFRQEHPDAALITHSKVDAAQAALDKTGGKWTDKTTELFLKSGKKPTVEAKIESNVGKKPHEIEKFENHNKLAQELNSFNKLSQAKRNGKNAEPQRQRINKLVEKLGYELKTESDGRLTAISDTGKTVKTIGLKEELPTPTSEQVTFAKRVIDDGRILTQGARVGDMKPSEIGQAIEDINHGKVNSQPAKRLILELSNIKDNGGIEYMQGGSGTKQNRQYQFVDFETLGFNLEHPDNVKLTPEQVEKESKEFDEYYNSLSDTEKQNLNNFIDDNYEKTNEGTESQTNVGNQENGNKGKGKISVGVSHRSLNDLATKLGLPEVKTGEVLTPKEYADRGRVLLQSGVDPNNLDSYTGKLHEKISVARAHLENLISAADNITDKNSQEYKDAKNVAEDYTNDVVKKLGTEAGGAMRSLQGERDLATDSFYEAERQIKANQDGKELSKEQVEKLQKLIGENKALKQKLANKEQALIDATDKELGSDTHIEELNKKDNETKRQQRIKKVDKFFDDAINSISAKGVAYATVIPPQVIKIALKGMKEAYHAGEEIGKIVEDAAKYISSKIGDNWNKDKFKEDYLTALSKIEKTLQTPEEKLLARKEKELSDLQNNIEKKRAKREYNLSDEEQQKLDKLNQDIKNIKISKIEKTLQTQFTDKKGNKFTKDDAKNIWNFAKEKYLNNGIEYNDMIKYVAGDLGLNHDQVRHAIVTPKTEPISIEKWKVQAELRKRRNETQRYIAEQGRSKLLTQMKKLSGDIRDIATFGHGHVFLGTHAGLTAFSNPELFAKYYKKAIQLSYLMKPHEIEQLMNDYNNNPLVAVFNKAGLQNDLGKMGTDSELASESHFVDLARKLHSKEGATGKFGKVLVGGIEAGHKGFMAIKMLRQALAEQAYNNLTKEEQKNPEVLKAIAELMNNATGGTNIKMNEGINSIIKEISFAGGMEMSRWEKLTKNPAKAISALAQMPLEKMGWIKELPPQDRVYAKIWAKRVLTQLVVYGGVSAISRAIFHKDDETPLDAMQKDIFKIKMGENRYTDMTSGMASLMSLIGKLYKAQTENKYGNSSYDVLGDYARKKLAPTYQTIAEGISGRDAMGNSVPFRDVKKSHKFNRNLTYPEYIESKLPLPVAEGFQQSNEAHNIAAGIMSGIISGTTGFKSYIKE